MDTLAFDDTRYEIRNFNEDGHEVEYRAYEDIIYCAKPADPIQKLNIYVPECYYNDGSLNGYTFKSAPIFMPNTVGGYLPGKADRPGRDFTGSLNAALLALEHGYVVVCAGIRGRTSGKESDEFFIGGNADKSSNNSGRLTGKAPALIVDYKAAIRYLRHNKERIPGDTEKIITSGTSAGGALSALAGASGNSADYLPYLEAIGAADERDDILAANCYCPIHNLENADAAYEWMFSSCHESNMVRYVNRNGRIMKLPVKEQLTDKQIRLSAELKKMFPEYLNSLGLSVSLDENGDGSFKDLIIKLLIDSAEKELRFHDSAVRLKVLMVPGSEVENCVTITNGQVTALDWDFFIKKITRMKGVPAFDHLDLSSPENEEFGTEETERQHFTDFAFRNSEAKGTLADPHIVSLLNPLTYVGKADTARYWRIRHGSFDRDTALAIPVILYLVLKQKGYITDFAMPWGIPHSGNYDLEELFSWIDAIAKSK